MESSDNLLSYPWWKITFKVHKNASDKHLGAIISQNNKTIELFSKIPSKSQRN